MLRPRTVALTALAVPCVWAGTAAAETNVGNRIADTRAQEGTAAWSGSGFTVNSGWEAPGHVSPENTLVGGPVFEATAPGAAITQTDSLTDLATAIDAGGQHLVLEGFFGGTGASSSGGSLSVEFLNASAEALGSPSTLGPPTAADRLDRTLLIPCARSVSVPVGARSAKVTLSGEPGGIANALYLATQGAAWALQGYASSGEYVRIISGDGQGLGCGHAELVNNGDTESPPAETPPPVRALPKVGWLAGVVLVSGGPARRPGHATPSRAVGYKVIIKSRSRVVRAVRTTKRGFKLHLAPGRYTLSGTQGACKSVTAVISRGRVTHATLRCSIR